MSTSVSILAEIPEELHLSMQGYLEGNPDWDQDRVFSAAISLFLLQNTVENSPEASLNYRRAAQVYLETLFRSDAEGGDSDIETSRGVEEVSEAPPEASGDRSCDAPPERDAA